MCTLIFTKTSIIIIDPVINSCFIWLMVYLSFQVIRELVIINTWNILFSQYWCKFAEHILREKVNQDKMWKNSLSSFVVVTSSHK